MPQRRPRAGDPRRDEHAGGVLEALGARQPRRLGHAHAVEADVGLPDRPRRALALHRHGLEPRAVGLDEKALDLAVLSERAHTTTTSAIEPLPIQRFAPSSTQSSPSRRARVSSATESDPWSGSVRANAPIASQPRHRGQPARLLLLGAEHVDRLHRQPGLHAEERAEAAVAAVQLHVHEAARERAHAGAAVAADVLPHEPQIREPAHQRPRQLRALPVAVDRREHLLVHEAARAQEQLPVGVVELLAQEEVVGGQRRAEPVVERLAHDSSGTASAWAIAR